MESRERATLERLLYGFFKQRTDPADMHKQFVPDVMPLLEILCAVVGDPNFATSVLPDLYL
jgi:hypothetical protein